MAYIDKDIFINNELIPLVKRLDLCHPKQKKGVLMAIQKLNEEPTADVVEVVRCENCIHRTEEDFCFKVASDVVPKKVKGDFFCSYGKKEGD